MIKSEAWENIYRIFSLPQDNFGYDLPAVEAAMKKHEAIEADIASYEERIGVVVELSAEMEAEGYYDIRRISARKENILGQWSLLKELVAGRRARLEKNLALQKTFQDMVYMIDWMEDTQVHIRRCPDELGIEENSRGKRNQVNNNPSFHVSLRSSCCRRTLGSTFLRLTICCRSTACRKPTSQCKLRGLRR